MIPIVCQNHIGTEYTSAKYNEIHKKIISHAVKIMRQFYGGCCICTYDDFENDYIAEYGAPLRYRWFCDNVWYDSTQDPGLCEMIENEYNRNSPEVSPNESKRLWIEPEESVLYRRTFEHR